MPGRCGQFVAANEGCLVREIRHGPNRGRYEDGGEFGGTAHGAGHDAAAEKAPFHADNRR